MPNVDIRHGEALAVLKTLESESIQCCITSPPYWGLRDYGTGEWVDGDPACDHKQNHGVQGATGQRADRTFTAQAVYRDKCLRCGGLRVDQQLGLEKTPEEYTARLVTILREVRRTLRDDGTLWLNMGDSYVSGNRQGHGTRLGFKQASNRGANDETSCERAPTPRGLKPKDLVGIPWRCAFALQADGWYLRSDIIWVKPAPMPESVTDRPTRSHEYIFLLAKNEKYYCDMESVKEPSAFPNGPNGAIKSPYGQGFTRRSIDRADEVENVHGNEPGRSDHGAACNKLGQDTRNLRDVWSVNTQPFPEAHFATFPPKLIEPCVIAGCPAGGTILDPFSGAGTTGLVAKKHGRNFIGIELNPQYVAMSERRLAQEVLEFT